MDVVAEPLEVCGRGYLTVRDGEQACDGLGRAGRSDEVAGDTLGRRRRRGSVAEHLANGLRLGRVVQWCRRSVRVDVRDVGRTQARVVECELHDLRGPAAPPCRRGVWTG